MDAPEDRDSKLHRASTRLLSDLSLQLPKLCSYKQLRGGTRSPRLWVRDAETYKIIQLVRLRTILPFELIAYLLGFSVRAFPSMAAASGSLSHYLSTSNH